MSYRSLAALALAVTLGWVLWSHGPSQAAVAGFDEATVRLYSGGEVVGEWEAVGPGRMEDHSFVFPVRKGTQELEMRIQGTFSFEPKR